MSGSTSNPALLAPLPNRPSRSKASILRYLPLVDLGNPYPWITCQAFLLLRMETTVFSWSSIDSQRWPLWWPARRITQQKPLLNSSLKECGYTLGSHSLSSHIGTTGSSIHFGRAFGQCWTPSTPSPQVSIPKPMDRRSSTWCSYTFCTCTTQTIHIHGTRASLMYNTTIIGLSIAQLATSPFRWDWDSSHYVPLIFPYHLQLLREIRLMSSLKSTELKYSLNESSTWIHQQVHDILDG